MRTFMTGVFVLALGGLTVGLAGACKRSAPVPAATTAGHDSASLPNTSAASSPASPHAGGAGAVTAPSASAMPETLQYEPSISTVSGVLEVRSFTNEADGTEERQLVVVLARPIRVQAGEDFDQPLAEDVDVVTLVPKRGFDEVARAKGTDVTVRGKLFAAHTAHHHTPVLLGDAEVIAQGGRTTAGNPADVGSRSQALANATPVFSRRSLHDVIGGNRTLTATDVASGKVITIQLSKSGWMQVGESEPFQFEKFTSMNAECIGYEKKLMGNVIPPQRSLLCNAVRGFSDMAMVRDVNSKIPVTLREGDFYFIEGRTDIGYRYSVVR